MLRKKFFSERAGITTSPNFLLEDVSPELRTRIWNFYYKKVFDAYRCDYVSRCVIKDFYDNLWGDFFNIPLNKRPRLYADLINYLHNHFFNCPWHNLFNFIEFSLEQSFRGLKNSDLQQEINRSFEKENSGYRVVNGLITEITNENEIAEINEALNSQHNEVKKHLEQALSLLSDRENPDFRNSIKESISAVESLAKKVTGDPKATLGEALKKLKENKPLHPAFEQALQKLYGWTSDGDGIRHALSDATSVTSADARFMLIVCSAFVNYLTDLTKD